MLLLWYRQMTIVKLDDWERFLARSPNHHFLQSAAWGKLKSEFGWQPIHLVQAKLGAQILFRKLPLGFHIAYIPKGPVYDAAQGYPPDWEGFWEEVDQICRAKRTIFLKVEPDIWLKAVPLPDARPLTFDHPTTTLPSAACPPAGFSTSPLTVQPPRTLVVDITGSEEQVLARMKQKTRYNIRLAQRRGVQVASSNNIDLFSRLMKETGERDAFGVHSQAYYQRALDLLHDHAEILVAELEGEPIAALFVVAQGRRAYYLYGASSNQQRDAMPTYLIQWEAMRWARQQGCAEYDLWGVPDVDPEVLEAEFLDRKGDLWGVYRFKRGFGGELRRSAGPWDRIYIPLLYNIYRRRAA